MRNDIVFEVKYTANGGEQRTIQNLLAAKDIHGNENVLNVVDYYERSTSTTNTSGGGTTNQVGGEVQVGWSQKEGVGVQGKGSGSHAWSNTWGRSVTHSADSPTIGPGRVPLDIPPVDITKNGTITFSKVISGRAEYDLVAKGHATVEPRRAEIRFDEFHVHNDVYYNAAVKTSTWIWEDAGQAPSITVSTWSSGIESTGEDAGGLETEPHSTEGEFGILRDEQSALDEQTFGLQASPAGKVSIPATMTLESGETFETTSFTALQEGSFTITATLLDEQGQPTSTTTSWSGQNTAFLSMATPTVSAGLVLDYARCRGDGGVEAIAGTAVGQLVVRRSCFDSFGTSPTTVSLGLDDPSSVISSLPTQLTIEAGQFTALCEVEFTSNTGMATITVTPPSGPEVVLVLHSIDLEASSMLPQITVPVNAICPLFITLNAYYESDISVSAAAANGSVASTTLPFGSSLGAGSMGFAIEVQSGASPGSTSLSITAGSAEFAGLTVPVTVRGAEVLADRSSIQLLGMDESTDPGIIELLMPDGVEFDSISFPSGYEAYMSAYADPEGRWITLTFLEGAERPETIEIDCSYTGPLSGSSFRLEVDDDVHTTRSHYFLVIP